MQALATRWAVLVDKDRMCLRSIGWSTVPQQDNRFSLSVTLLDRQNLWVDSKFPCSLGSPQLSDSMGQFTERSSHAPGNNCTAITDVEHHLQDHKPDSHTSRPTEASGLPRCTFNTCRPTSKLYNTDFEAMNYRTREKSLVIERLCPHGPPFSHLGNCLWGPLHLHGSCI